MNNEQQQSISNTEASDTPTNLLLTGQSNTGKF